MLLFNNGSINQEPFSSVQVQSIENSNAIPIEQNVSQNNSEMETERSQKNNQQQSSIHQQNTNQFYQNNQMNGNFPNQQDQQQNTYQQMNPMGNIYYSTSNQDQINIITNNINNNGSSSIMQYDIYNRYAQRTYDPDQNNQNRMQEYQNTISTNNGSTRDTLQPQYQQSQNQGQPQTQPQNESENIDLLQEFQDLFKEKQEEIGLRIMVELSKAQMQQQ